LRYAQHGLTIEEISKKLNLSRTTTTKDLNSLFVSGQVNMRKVGPAKLYTLSTRLPAEQIISQSSDLILILDETYTVRDVSDSFLLVFGGGKDDFKDLNINATLIGPVLIDRIRDPVRQGLAGNESVVNAWIPIQKEWKEFRIRIIPLVFGWGEKGVVVMLEDRTAEILSGEENALLADLVNASPAAITVHDLQGNFLYSNKKNLDLHGYSQSEFLNLNLTKLEISESAKRSAERMKELKKTGEAISEVVHLRKDGQHIPLEVHAKIARWGDRDVVISIATDISERKRAEEELRESEHKFATVFNSNPVSLTLVSASDGVFVDVNDTFSRNSGYTREELIGKTSEELGIFADNNEYAKMVSLLQNQRHVHGMELRCRIKSGEIRACRFSSGIIMMGEKPHILSTVEDITEQQQEESAFQAMVTSMVGTTGMESLDRITESISTWLGADCIMIGEITPDRERVQVLSMLLDGRKITDYSYSLKGTPCENTAKKGFCIFPDEVCKLFPKSRDLHEFKIRGYIGTPLRNFEGQVVGILCILTRKPLNLPPSAHEIIDVIAVKAAAEIGRRSALHALHESERKFRTIFENSPYPISINTIPDGRFIQINTAFLHSSGYTETEVLGKTPVEIGLLSLLDFGKLASHLLLSGKLENVSMTLIGKGSRRIHVLFSTIPVNINDKPAIMTVTAEVTRLKRIEEELYQQNLVLETINQLALEFASLPRGTSVPQQAVKSLMKLSGAVLTLFSIYDPSDRTLQVTNYEIAPGMLEKIIPLLGKRPGDVKTPVSTDVYQEMVSTIIGKRKTLTEASFGLIPPLVSTSIQMTMSIDRFIGIAYVIEGNLYGTSLLAMKSGQPDPSTELLESFAHIVAISLRRDRDETGT
jgi:PAS domain S-box-containing protein